MKMTIGERIKKEREILGWSQEALALASEISQRSIGHYELGQRDPQSVTINKIMGAMGFRMQFVKEGVESE
jgi:transcriptional regulator with XRE-family HTH domain